MPKTYYVYIMTNRTRSTLYIGMTGNLAQRMEPHVEGDVDGFTKRYYLDRLLYHESFSNPTDAKQREKQHKKWNCAWKERLIEEANPTWRDLREG